jgi:hypothetical protein
LKLKGNQCKLRNTLILKLTEVFRVVAIPDKVETNLLMLISEMN